MYINVKSLGFLKISEQGSPYPTCHLPDPTIAIYLSGEVQTEIWSLFPLKCYLCPLLIFLTFPLRYLTVVFPISWPLPPNLTSYLSLRVSPNTASVCVCVSLLGAPKTSTSVPITLVIHVQVSARILLIILDGTL